MSLIPFFIGAGLGVTIGDLILAQWARTGATWLLILGLVMNLIGIVFFAQTLRFESVGLAVAVFLGLNILLVSLGGYILLGQSMHTRGIFGLVLMAIAIIIIEI